jgi:hypothetical protein
MVSPILELTNINKSFGHVQANKNINLKINKLTLRQLIHDGIRKLSLKNDQFASVRINYSRGTNEGRTLRIDSTLETKNLDNLWLKTK